MSRYYPATQGFNILLRPSALQCGSPNTAARFSTTHDYFCLVVTKVFKVRASEMAQQIHMEAPSLRTTPADLSIASR